MDRSVVIILGICCLPRLAAAQSNVVLVRVEPQFVTVQPGELFTVDLVADVGANQVIGWGLDLPYDASVVGATGSPAIGPLWLAAFAPDGDGLSAFAPLGSLSGNDLLLARVTFRALTAGQTQLSPGYTPADLNEGFPLDPSGYAQVAFRAGTVDVLPEPSTSLLLASAAILAVRFRRRGA